MKLAPGAQNSMPKDADALTIASNDFAQSTVPGHARDAGLVRTVGTFGLAASVINSVIGAGIFIVPAAMAAATGVYACLAFLGCAVAMGTVVLCFAEGGRRVPTSGGPYGYIEAAFGPIAGSIAGTLVWVSAVLACGGVLAALADSLASVVSPTFAAAARAGVIVSALGFLVAINLRGVSSGTRFIAAATLVKLVPLLIFIAVGAGAMHATNFHAASTTVSPEGFGRAAILAMFTLVGMETALGASGEVARPTRTIPRALITAMAFVALLYVSIQLIAQGILGAALATSSAPLADAMSRINPTLRALLLAGASVSMVAWIGSDILGSPRVLFALARDGLLPSVLGRVHARTRVPYAAIVCYAAIAAVLALSGSFAELAVVATLASAALYLAGCAAVWRLTWSGRAESASIMSTRWLVIAAAAGIVSMFIVIILATWAEIAGLAATILAGALAYHLQRGLRSRARD